MSTNCVPGALLSAGASNSPQLPDQMETDTEYEGVIGGGTQPRRVQRWRGRKRKRRAFQARNQEITGQKSARSVTGRRRGEGCTWGPDTARQSRQKRGPARTGAGRTRCWMHAVLDARGAGCTLMEKPLKHAGQKSKLRRPGVQGDFSGPELRGQCRA